MKIAFFAAYIAGFAMVCSAADFQGRITVAMTRDGETHNLLYTAGTNFLRIDCLETDHPYASDILDLGSREMTLVFHHNRSFVSFAMPEQNAPPPPPGFPQMPPNFPQATSPSAMRGAHPAGGMPGPLPPAMPSGIGPTNLPGMSQPPMPPMPAMPQKPAMPNMPPMPTMQPPGVGPQAGMGGPRMVMPMMPPMPGQAMELHDTGETTNILGYSCARYELKERGEVMEIWATDQLLPFQAYLQNQPHRFGPRMIEEQWGGLLAEKKLFPLLASLKFQNGSEMFHFEVTRIRPEKIEDKDGALSKPPAEYNEIQPLPF